MNVVSIMAHQDDEMRCLGTMLKCRARGDRLHFICLTDGSAGVLRHEAPTPADAARLRAAEMGALARAADASYRCLNERDEFMMDTPELRLALVEAIRATGAELVFTHHQEDYNLDHTLAHRLVKHGCMLASLPLLPTASPPLRGHPAVYCVEPHGPIPFPASVFVDITGFEAAKAELLAKHESQERAMRAAVGSGMAELCGVPDAYWGQKAGCRYAEAFLPMEARGAIKTTPVLP